MIREEYAAARRLAQKKYKKDVQNGTDPYPASLDDILEKRGRAGEEYLGLQQISLSQVKGTKETARMNAFGSTFLPLLPEDSEFAFKWSNLYETQMDEGIREPVIAFEYLNEYYIREGNKRVSIMKYLGMPDISAYVTRILPRPSEDEVLLVYQRFLKFSRKTGILDILFSDKNGYDRLEAATGLEGETDAAVFGGRIRELKRCYHRFRYAYRRCFGEVGDRQIGDAFLVAFAVRSYGELKELSVTEHGELLSEMAKEVKPSSGEKKPEYALAPEDREPALFGRVLPMFLQTLSVAFVYDQSREESAWVYCHELGRRYVEDVFGEKIHTTVYESVSTGFSAAEVLEEVIRDGNRVIFTATPNLIQASVKTALAHPEVIILNCSLCFSYQSVHTYYARAFEVKFLLGVLAGILTETDRIVYEADYPIYGTAANINAFAIGVNMVNPKARIRLHWDCVKEPEPEDPAADFVSARHMLKAPDSSGQYGLYRRREGINEGYATCVLDWGKMYENILRAVLNGRFKNRENLWWGLSSEVVDVLISNRVPEGAKRLVEALKPTVRGKSVYPFEGRFSDQSGREHGKEGVGMSQEEIIHMDWLFYNIDGRVPGKEELKEEALEIVNLQGV